jgi:hypothetical protein
MNNLINELSANDLNPGISLFSVAKVLISNEFDDYVTGNLANRQNATYR